MFPKQTLLRTYTRKRCEAMSSSWRNANTRKVAKKTSHQEVVSSTIK